jgi:hypothetical protein
MQQVFQLSHGGFEFALQAFDLGRLAGQRVRFHAGRQEGELFHG